jgi:predicted DNA-binding protein
MVPMHTPLTHRRRLGGDLSDYAFRLPTWQREQMQAIAAHRGWSEAEAMRRAVALFLDQNRDLLLVLTPKDEVANGR